MKTYVVQLEDHDDVITVQDKISWSKANRVLLVWPRRGKVLERPLDLLLLQRHARQLGAQLAIVTASLETRAMARDLGIPVFTGAKAAQLSTWRKERRRRRPSFTGRVPQDPNALRKRREALLTRNSENNSIRLAAFVLGVVSFLALALFFAPGAEVELKPLQELQQLTIPVRASPEIRVPNPSGGIPAEIFSVVVEGRDQAASTGRARIPDQAAAGRVTLTNLTDQAVSIPAGSVVLAPGEAPHRYQVVQEVQVPAGPGKTTEADIQAEAPGSDSNLPAGQIRALEGPLGLRVSVDNPGPIGGGADRFGTAPGEDDYQALKAKLLSALAKTAGDEIQTKIGPGQRLLEGTLHIKQVIEETREPAENQPGDQLQLSIRAEYQAWAVREADLQAVAQAALNANRLSGSQPVDGSLRVEFASEPVLSVAGEANALWDLRVEQSVQPRWTKADLVSAIRGRSLEEARRILHARIPLASDPRIHMFPAWWGRLPYLPFRIMMVQT